MEYSIKTQEDFKGMMCSSTASAVETLNTFKALLLGGEVIFGELTDGYVAFFQKKSYGLAKPKTQIMAVSFPEDESNVFEHKKSEQVYKVFNAFMNDGIPFFYVPGLTLAD
jgi:hypothetical protein